MLVRCRRACLAGVLGAIIRRGSGLWGLIFLDPAASRVGGVLSGYIGGSGGGLAAFGVGEFVGRLQGIVGAANVVFHPDDLLVFEYDGSIDRGMPRAVAFPLNTHEG